MAIKEFWLQSYGSASGVARDAVQAEKEGWDGIQIAVGPTHVADPWVSLALAARDTSRIMLATGVTNPTPQIAPALAGSATTVQQESNGRVVVGIGRGD